jgi:ribosomal protein S18 acetylase RimI-like enzyme
VEYRARGARAEQASLRGYSPTVAAHRAAGEGRVGGAVEIAPLPTLPTQRSVEAAAALAAAFACDPAWCWALPDAAHRARVLPWFFRAAIRYVLRHGEVLAAGSPILGAALVLPPERPRLRDGDLARAGLWQMPFRAGPRGFRRFVAQGRMLDQRHDADVPKRHIYVWLLGVDPARHGLGLGSALLRAVIARADAARAPTYLDTTNERNLVFYGRAGFEIVHAGRFPGEGCRFWTLVRPPVGGVAAKPSRAGDPTGAVRTTTSP